MRGGYAGADRRAPPRARAGRRPALAILLAPYSALTKTGSVEALSITVT